jgi:hypothetical protein
MSGQYYNEDSLSGYTNRAQVTVILPQSRHTPRITSSSASPNQHCLRAIMNCLLVLKSKQNQNLELITSFVASTTSWRVAGSGNMFTSYGALEIIKSETQDSARFWQDYIELVPPSSKGI